MPPRLKRDTAFYFALLLLAAIMGFGVALNWLVPIYDIDTWFRLILWGNWVRAPALISLIYVSIRTTGAHGFDIRGIPTGRWLIHAAIILSLWGIFLTAATGEPWSIHERVLGIASCFLVGAYEEYFFRGILLKGFRNIIGRIPAILTSSLLFTLFHTRLQAIAAWPHIFLTGVVFASLRCLGMSIGQLALIHAAIDSLFFLVGKHSVQELGNAYWIFLSGLFVYAVVLHHLNQKSRRA